MSEVTGQDEARRALTTEALTRIAGEIEQNLREHPNRPMKRMLLTDEVWAAVVAALRAPSLDRGAEEMRERCAKLCDEEAWSQLHLGQALRDRVRTRSADVAEGGREAAATLAAAIRALPVPADLNDGGGK